MGTTTMQNLARTIADTKAMPAVSETNRILLNRYEVLGRLGSGAMGEVLKVKDLQSGLEYALKRAPFFSVEGDQAKRIQANFALVSRLTHPHIATTRFFEQDPVTGEAYQIMDLVNGTTLTKWLQAKRRELGGSDKPLPLDLVLGLAGQLASALDYAHQQPTSSGTGPLGVLHRDLKPDNIMVEAGREFAPGIPYLRIVDFGLAAEAQAAIHGHSIASHNQEGGGTLYYMAPEQWDGRALTPGVDQWALAVIVYEMLAGRKPFEAGDRIALYKAVRAADPRRVEHLPLLAWNALRKAFQADRRNRHASCTALVQGMRPADLRLDLARAGERMSWAQWLLIPVQIAIFLVVLALGLEGVKLLKAKADEWINGKPPTPVFLYPRPAYLDPSAFGRNPLTPGSRAAELLKELDKKSAEPAKPEPRAEKTAPDPYFDPTGAWQPKGKSLAERLRELEASRTQPAR
ncbi:MAG: serine/threonine protein kinase [Planctomycetota bacterium]|nr:serine/threonine protein kinase [Planctomycetota bacterium]